MLKINFLTLFPKKISSYFTEGLQARAIEKNIFSINIINLRDFSNDKFSRVDDTVYGGGPGMLLKVEPVFLALNSLGAEKGKVCYLSPSGKTFSQSMAREFSLSNENLTFLSGYYEGIDQRIIEHLVDVELSLGNYVLSSGDLPALCIADSIIRLLPNFLDGESLLDESHNIEGILEYPQYTKPSIFNDWKVPDVLLSGNHKDIAKWKEANRK